jgi:hypothetical protein
LVLLSWQKNVQVTNQKVFWIQFFSVKLCLANFWTSNQPIGFRFFGPFWIEFCFFSS